MNISKYALLFFILIPQIAAAQDKVKVFILAGQSNMQGKGWYNDRTPTNGIDEDGTLQKLIDNDPNGTYDYLQSSPGNYITRTDVNIFTNDGNRSGGLSVGYGTDSTMIGPELGFGWQVGDNYTEDVLIIKTNWGGKSLKTDFRPPSAALKRGGETGFYYNEILNVVDSVRNNIGAYVPGYAGQGSEIQGFGWHQGFNDRIDQSAVDEYELNLVDFINDIRFDLKAAELPFVVANTGIGGPGETNSRALDLMQKQLNVDGDSGLYPEFAGNVETVDTQPMWRDASISPITSGNQGFHWNHNGETMFIMGDAMGTEMNKMDDYVQFQSSYLEVNQQTGEIKIINPSDNNVSFDLEAYTINSASGALNPAAWDSIADNHEGTVGGTWTVDTATSNTLSESTDTEGSVGIGIEVSLGTGAWVQNLDKDLSATYTDTDGIPRTLYIQYSGNDNILADLNFDGDIDVADWGLFITSAQADMSGLSGPQAYQLGDLDGDLDNDVRDFILFRQAFELENPGAGAFEAMLAQYASVPEPASLVLMGMCGVLFWWRRSTGE